MSSSLMHSLTSLTTISSLSPDQHLRSDDYVILAHDLLNICGAGMRPHSSPALFRSTRSAPHICSLRLRRAMPSSAPCFTRSRIRSTHVHPPRASVLCTLSPRDFGSNPDPNYILWARRGQPPDPNSSRLSHFDQMHSGQMLDGLVLLVYT